MGFSWLLTLSTLTTITIIYIYNYIKTLKNN